MRHVSSSAGVQTVEITIAPRIEENLVIGGTVHRRCQATNGTWIVTWLDPRGRVISGNDLDLSRIRFAQLGRYKCIARARNGEEVTGQILIENATLSRESRSMTSKLSFVIFLKFFLLQNSTFVR